MTVKELFRKLSECECSLELLYKRRDKCVALSGYCMNPNKVQNGSSQSSPTEKIAIELVELDQRIQKTFADYFELSRIVEQVLSGMKSAKNKELLTRRYIYREKWQHIASSMGYRDVRSVHYAHGRALCEAQRNCRIPLVFHLDK